MNKIQAFILKFILFGISLTSLVIFLKESIAKQKARTGDYQYVFLKPTVDQCTSGTYEDKYP